MSTLARASICVLTLALAVSVAGADERINWIAAKVNGEIITWADIDKKIGPTVQMIQSNDLLPSSQRRAKVIELREQAREEAINDALMLQAARKLRIKVSEGELQRKFEKRVQALGGDEVAREWADERGFTWGELRKTFKDHLTIVKLLQQKAGFGASSGRHRPTADPYVRPADIRRYYQQHPAEFRVAEALRIRRIVLPWETERSREVVRRAAAAIRDQLEKGADFASLARLHGARYGGRSPIQMVEGKPQWQVIRRGDLEGGAVERAAFGLAAGATTAPLETDDGILLIRVEERQKARTVPFSEAQALIRRKLENERYRKNINQVVKELRATAVITIPKRQ